MRRIIALFLSITMLLTGCVPAKSQMEPSNVDSQVKTLTDRLVWDYSEPRDFALDDKILLSYIEDLVYGEAVLSLNSEDYFIENVSAVYISKEYIDELAFNSQANIFYGYTLAELDDIFQGIRYIFTLDENGQTTVTEMLAIEDLSTETMLKDVAIGTGVILVCVTVSAVSAGVGAPAVSVIFATSAKTGAIMALSSGALGGLSAGIVTGIETGDLKKSKEEALLVGSEAFKWGAIAGAIVGGVGETFALKQATANGLTMNEVAIIQKDSMLPKEIITQLHSLEEYYVYKDVGLRPIIVNNKVALVQNIDLNYVSQLPDGNKVTNLVRMQKGYAPLDPKTGKAYQLHHIGQKKDATLAILTEAQHQGNSTILNIVDKTSEINRSEFTTVRKEFWEYMGKVVFANGGI